MASSCWVAIVLSVTFITAQCSVMDFVVTEGRKSSRSQRSSIGTTMRGQNNDNAGPPNRMRYGELSDEWINEMLVDSPGSYLAGENTPVWTVFRAKSGGRVIYTKLNKLRVKQAVESMNIATFEPPSTPLRTRIAMSSIDAVQNFWSSVSKLSPRPNRRLASTVRRYNSCCTTVAKYRLRQSAKVVNPSIVLVMDYVDSWPGNAMEHEKLINERIVYALAFWKAVDLQLRYVQNPKVRLRISGILIARNRQAVPYLHENYKKKGLKMHKAFESMLSYWRNLTKENRQFPMKGYHIVATMTNLRPARNSESFNESKAACSFGPPCRQKFRSIGGLLVSDDLAFSGIQDAVRKMAYVLGAPRDWESFLPGNDRNSAFLGRNLPPSYLEEISNHLRSCGGCLREPRELEPSGFPIKPILPGALISAEKKCETRGQKRGICWEQSSCEHLYCKKKRSLYACKDIGPFLDGTKFNNGKVCLDGKSVSNNKLADVLSRG